MRRILHRIPAQSVIKFSSLTLFKRHRANELTYWGRDKMDVISQTTSSSMKNENVWIPIKISMKFVPKGPINNIPSLVQIVARRRPGDKPLSEPIMVVSPTHVSVTGPQWVNVTVTQYEDGLWLCVTHQLQSVTQKWLISCLTCTRVPILQSFPQMSYAA